MFSFKTYNIVLKTEPTINYDVFGSIHCPNCDTLQRPVFKNHVFANGKLYLLCYCEECKNVFIAAYNCHRDLNINYAEVYIVDSFCKAYQSFYKNSNFSNYINGLSPMFVKVYDQALTADSFGLDEIAGMGFRKALEFLVKDYAISLFPNEREHIEKMHLSDTIDKINYQPITDIAKPCIKVLNDETHYFRKFEKVEVANINKLILAIVGILSAKFIASEIVIPTSDDSSTPPTA